MVNAIKGRMAIGVNRIDLSAFVKVQVAVMQELHKVGSFMFLFCC